MTILTNARCVSKYGSQILNLTTEIYAGETGQNNNACQGDSGGPLVVKHKNGLWYLADLTSWVNLIVSFMKSNKARSKSGSWFA